MKNIKNKKVTGLLSVFLISILLIVGIPSVLATTEYEYSYYIHIANSPLGLPWGEIVSGDESDLETIDNVPVHFTSTPYLFVYMYFDRPGISNGAGELKVVYDYYSPPAQNALFMTIAYYGSSETDHYTLSSGPWIDPPEYQTETYSTQYGLDVLFVQFVLYGGDLWLDYLSVKYSSSGGGGCPILSVFDGDQYQEEGLLDIHDPEGNDVIYQHELINSPAATINNRFQLRLTEHPKTISHIDRVELWGKLSNNRMIKLRLISAIHCEEGQVKSLLKFSDDKKVDALGADHNNGISQFIDLEFYAPRHIEFDEFVFVIEGNNAFEK